MLEQPISKAGWTRVSFGDVARNINDYFERDGDEAARYIAGEHVDEGQTKVRRWGMTDDGFFPPTFKRKFQAGDVLFHSRNVKKVVVPDFDGVTGEKLFVLRSKDDRVVSQDFLGHLLSSETFRDYAERNWSGSVNKFFNWKPLSKFEFLLPPIQEQARIVEMLKSASDAVNALYDLADRTEALLGSLILEALELRGFARSEGYKGRFELKTGEDVYTAKSGNGEPIFSEDGDTLFFKVADFNRNADHRSLSYAEATFDADENPAIRVFPPGTVVFPKRGASIFLNKIGILSRSAALDPNLMALETDPACASSEFLMWLFKGVGLWRFADTTSVPQLNHKHLKPIPIPLPSVCEQEILTGQLSRIADALANTRQRLENAKANHVRIREDALEHTKVST